jgi:hypothetical protein
VHGSNAKNLSYSYLYLKLAKMLCFSYYLLCFLFSSTKLEKRAEQVLPGSEKCGRKREGAGSEARDGPNNVCTYEYMNKQ